MLDVVRAQDRGHAHDRLQTHSPLRRIDFLFLFFLPAIRMQADELCCGVFCFILFFPPAALVVFVFFFLFIDGRPDSRCHNQCRI